ncbi:tRNA pseudouridine synthase B [Blochmannia endosymbiont of Camponotus (Colobopsis) obliquus]|nr:tRNA pseudouridine synthase B [Blochmannia endosymbiont of Camponotus (Colobopsis) obliquus]
MLNDIKHRVVDGILLLDKSSGETSNAALGKIKKLFRANKVGHTGSLDPLATGMLPICFGEATKFSQYLINADKRYYVIAKFGKRTDTFDSEGRVVSIRPVNFTENQLYKAIDFFKGQHLQVPPMFSAVKYQGCPLYRYARKGIKIPRTSRLINIYNIDVLLCNKKNISLEIHCSKGTYIRTIIDDLGEYLGCGAYVVALRRLTVANFSTSSMISFAKLHNLVDNDTLKISCCSSRFNRLDKLLLPIDSALLDMPVLNVSLSVANVIRYGQTVEIVTDLNNCLVRIMENSGQRFIGVGEILNKKQLVPRRLVSSSIIL